MLDPESFIAVLPGLLVAGDGEVNGLADEGDGARPLLRDPALLGLTGAAVSVLFSV